MTKPRTTRTHRTHRHHPTIPNAVLPHDLAVFQESHPMHTNIIYDSDTREYYYTKIDIFLSDEDIAFHRLRPYSAITSPLPSPLPENYFTNWTAEC